ncbi:hypothetical protein PO124_12130 [Bacillus licheniformis]|nr:hypothetical protein [Bacillus licheniformis]
MHHLKDLGTDINAIDRHLGPQYIEGEEEFVTNYIYLEQFSAQIREIENKYKLLKSPLSQLSQSPHHLSDIMIKKGSLLTPFDYVNLRLGVSDF